MKALYFNNPRPDGCAFSECIMRVWPRIDDRKVLINMSEVGGLEPQYLMPDITLSKKEALDLARDLIKAIEGLPKGKEI